MTEEEKQREREMYFPRIKGFLKAWLIDNPEAWKEVSLEQQIEAIGLTALAGSSSINEQARSGSFYPEVLHTIHSAALGPGMTEVIFRMRREGFTITNLDALAERVFAQYLQALERAEQKLRAGMEGTVKQSSTEQQNKESSLGATQPIPNFNHPSTLGGN